MDKNFFSPNTNNTLPGISRLTKSLDSSIRSPRTESTRSLRHIQKTMPDTLEIGGTIGLSLIVKSASFRSQEGISSVFILKVVISHGFIGTKNFGIVFATL